jgi:cytochrome c oxidase subunit 3
MLSDGYKNGEFTIADSLFGSIFYITTGLHALHVIVGVLFLAVGLIRLFRDSLTTSHHLGLEFPITSIELLVWIRNLSLTW